MDKKRATIYDIAKALNVTTSTVSRSLNDSHLISEATKETVLKMAKKLDYRPNKLASSLSSGRSYIVGVIIPSATIQFFSAFLSSLESTLKKHGYSIILYQTNESSTSELNGIRTMLEAQVDGIIISPSLETQSFDFIQKIKDEGKAVLVFDRMDDQILTPMVGVNDELAGFIAANHLIEQGYRKIAYVSTKSNVKIFKDRYDGFQRALKEHKIDFNKDHLILDDVSIESGMAGTKKLLSLKNRPDAIIGGDDFTALGIISMLQKNGIVPPEIGVMGFANQIFSEYITPSLTTIDQQADKMGVTSAKLFIEMVSNGKNKTENKKLILEPILIVRDSTRQNN